LKPANVGAWPGETGHFFKNFSTMQVNQNLLIAQVVKFLNGNGYLVWRCENNGRIDEPEMVKHLHRLFTALAQVNYSTEQKAKLFTEAIRRHYKPVPCTLKGVADVIGFNLKTGNMIAAEIKIGNDQLRAEQIAFMDVVKSAGGEYWLVREIESFKQGWLCKHQPQMLAA